LGIAVILTNTEQLSSRGFAKLTYCKTCWEVIGGVA
jgi:hypothetical protein